MSPEISEIFWPAIIFGCALQLVFGSSTSLQELFFDRDYCRRKTITQ